MNRHAAMRMRKPIIKTMLLAFLSPLLLGLSPCRAQTGGNDESSKYSFNYRNVVPGMPENAALGGYGGTPVSTATGLLDVSYTLYTVSFGGVNVPITISHNSSGAKYSDIPSCVGMKWSLSTGGSINRSVNGLADEDYLLDNLDRVSQPYINYENLHVNGSNPQDSCGFVARNLTDCSLDYFFYSYPGGGGSMYLGPGRKFYADKEYSKIKISFTDHLDYFTIKDDAGNTYIYGGAYDQSAAYHTGKYFHQSHNFFARVAWKLIEIITATKKKIYFDYLDFCYYSYNQLNSERYTAYTLPQGPGAPKYDDCLPVGINDDSYSTTQFINTASLLTKIRTDDQEVIFKYQDNESLPIWKKQLTDIKVYSKISGDTVKRIQLNYGELGSNVLANFCELDSLGHPVKKYGFSYYGGPMDPTSFNRDILGYYNGNSNQNLMANNGLAGNTYGYPFTLANRSVNGAFACAGSLQSIAYPTGGTSYFVYEYNTDTVNNAVYYAPGVRIKEMRDYDINNQIYNIKRFYYHALQGGHTFTQLSVNNEDQVTLNPTIIGVFLSDNTDIKGLDDFYYQQVVTENVSVAGSTYSKDYYTSEFDIYDKVKPLLARRDIFKDDTSHILKSTEYQYQFTNVDSVKISSYVLAKPLDYEGLYSYEGSTDVYHFCTKTIYRGYEQDHLIYPILTNLVSQTDKDFSSSPELDNEQVNTYYDYPAYLKTSQTTDSKGNLQKMTYEYPFNYPAVPVLKQMIDSNLLVPHITETSALNNVSIFQKKNDFAFNVTGFFQPTLQHLYNLKQGGEQIYHFYSYDNNANLLEQGKDNDIVKSYIWDYQAIYPVAEVANAPEADIAFTSFESDGTGNWGIPVTQFQPGGITGSRSRDMGYGNINKSGLTAAKTYIVSFWAKTGASISVAGASSTVELTQKGDWHYWEATLSGVTSTSVSGSGIIDELRLYPKNAQMTTYTYRPLVGVASQCDPNNRITYYEYDAFGRLARIRDMDGNIIKTIDYHYVTTQ